MSGKNITTLTNKIMKFLYTDNLAKKFSFFGKRDNKKPFSECLLKTAVIKNLLLLLLYNSLISKFIKLIFINFCNIIEDAVKSCHLDATDRSVEDVLKIWLKHAPQCLRVSLQNKNNDRQ